MNKIIYSVLVALITLIAITAIFLPWNQLTLQSRKYDLLHQETYQTRVPATFQITTQCVAQDDHFAIVVTLDQATINHHDVKLLVVDGREKETPTQQLYPSIGIVNDFGLSLVPSGFTTDQKEGLVLIYQTDIAHPQLYVWVYYHTDDGQSHNYYMELAA